MKINKPLAAIACLLLLVLTPALRGQTAPRAAGRIPAPKDVFGFVPGDDRKLASWQQVVTYFEDLDKASERMKFEVLGKTTLGAPFVMATISTPENLERLAVFREIQDQLADPRKLGPPAQRDRRAAALISRGKNIVLITCGIHSTEVGSYLSSTLIAHRLASSNEPEIQNILRNTIILLVPSLNPDGVDIVKKWYDKTLGTPYEGTEPPELYHHYIGHDNNRDWYAFTQPETQITVTKIHNVWHPQIVHDIHQQGAYGSRMFLPPYMPPVEPNVPQKLIDGYTQLGGFIAREMRSMGFQGITTGTTYDAWTPARAYSHYHGGVRMLSETASARLASPITVKFDELRSREGYNPQKASEKFGPVWHGGDWHLRDITNYMTTAAFKLLEHAAVNREAWLRRFYEVGKEAVRPRRRGELFAFILPNDDQKWPANENRETLLRILETGGVELTYTRPFRLGATRYGAGTAVVRMDQPYGAFAKTLLERQTYPNLRDDQGNPIAPYDVTAHTLPLLMNVKAVEAYAPVRFQRQHRDAVGGGGRGCSHPPTYALYRSFVPSMDEGWTRWIFDQRKSWDRCFGYERVTDRQIRDGKLGKYGAIVIPDQAPAALLNGHSSNRMPAEYAGGLGEEGVKKLKEYVEAGGTLVFLNRASIFAIEHFKLPLRNVVAGVSRKDYYVPGSILRIELDESHGITEGMPKQSIAWVEDSPVFEVTDKPQISEWGDTANVRVIARYTTGPDLLLSGWMLGGERIKGKAALVEVKMGQGQVVLFGFRPQYRAQSLATYPLLFNALSR